MPNIKSKAKRVKTNNKRRAYTSAYKSSMRTAVKNVEAAITSNDKAAAETNLKVAYKKLDKAISKGIVHKNFAANQKARLAKKVNSL
ncbi:MAG: 30S ribosomal protein S20 [Bacilli bacterium]